MLSRLAICLALVWAGRLFAAELPAYAWMEAENFAPLKGVNFSFQRDNATTREAWSVAGPGVAAEWTMGGESEWMSIAARADVTNEVTVSYTAYAPVSGEYRLLVRYADYRGKREEFGVRVRQGDKVQSHVFGKEPHVEELDPMKMFWNWAFAWDEAPVQLMKGGVAVEIYTTGVTEARRAVDCICLTTDPNYHPRGREKPDFPTWRTMRDLRSGKLELGPNVLQRNASLEFRPSWVVSRSSPAFLWNTDVNWAEEIKKTTNGIDDPFGLDVPLANDFMAAFRNKRPPVYSDELSGPVISVSRYPSAFTNDSPFMKWLARHPERKFAILLNYAEPDWFKGAHRAGVYGNLMRVEKQFTGFIAGEGIAYANTDTAPAYEKIRKAHTRQEILAALREMEDKATVAKFSNYFGSSISSAEAWSSVISCLSANMETYCHMLCGLGVNRIGHENTGNSPTLARRLAFLRGASRQFGTQIVNYQSCNLGDAATMFSRQNYLYPGSSRYILDNQYDTWAGAGHHWLLKDYLLWHMAGVDAFYNEQGIDIFWKPGGNSAGDDFPVELSPKGRTTEFAQKIAHEHDRGTQFTPIAFLLDEAHGWSQERFQPGAFQLDPQLNPNLLLPGHHEASIRGWFDLAWFPAPETQNEPASAIRQTFVNGMFGDTFDVIVTAPRRTEIVNSYGALVLAGEVFLTEAWGKALRQYVERSGTLVVCGNQLSGPGASEVRLPTTTGNVMEPTSFTWADTRVEIPTQLFRFRPIEAGSDRVLATANGQPLVTAHPLGQGQIIFLNVPLGLGLDDRPVAVLGLILQKLVDGLMPIKVRGDVESVLNQTAKGDWIVTLFNNNGYIKPQHGILPTDQSQEVTVIIQSRSPIAKSSEWVTGRPVTWTRRNDHFEAQLVVPAAGVRFVEFRNN